MRVRPIVGWAVFCFLIAIIAQAVPSVTGAYYFLKGRGYYSKGNYSAAAEAYQHSVATDPNFARGYVELGFSYSQLKRYSEAEEAFLKATSIWDDSCAQCGLGIVYRLQRKTKEAETALQRARSLGPSDTCALNQLGRLYYEQERYSEAVEAFNEEISINPSAVSYHFVGNSYIELDQFEKARDAYLEALRLDPQYTNALAPLGDAYYGLGQFRESIDVYRKAVSARPNDVDARVSLGLLELTHGTTEAAFEQYLVARKLDPIRAELLKRAINRR